MTILGVDIGTTGMKMALYGVEQEQMRHLRSYSREYAIHTYNNGLFSDIDQSLWIDAFIAGCRRFQDDMPSVDVIALSGTTPGLTAMDASGNALYPAILMLDQRSRAQAQHIIDTVGLDILLASTGNMPVAGGCSLASMLWLKEMCPEIYVNTEMFGHSNTYFAKWLTGSFAIDPSSASLTALYNTVRNDYQWNEDIAAACHIPTTRLPRVIPSHGSAGRVRQTIARQLGMHKEPPVVIGGNDAVLAAYSVGIREPGEIMNVNGTCEISLICLPECIASTKYNVRAHVIPDRWLTLYVMNAGGIALEWFRKCWCGEMDGDRYYGDFLPCAIDTWLERESSVRYVPYLLGSRYSLEQLTAEFTGLTAETTRDEMMAALIRGLCEYQREHLAEIEAKVPLSESICVSGGAVNPSILRAKMKWMRNCAYNFEEQSSVKGAALLGKDYLELHGT